MTLLPHQPLQDVKGLIEQFNAMQMDGASYPCMAREYGVSGGMVFRIIHEGYEPKRDDIRKALDLPILAPTPVCPTCGIVHTLKRCPAGIVRKPRKARSRWIDGLWKG